MKSKICILGSVALGVISLCMLAEETSPGGIVYGPKASFNISAPEGWVVDNESGKGQECRAFFTQKVVVVGREDGDVRESSQPSMGRRKRIRGNRRSRK